MAQRTVPTDKIKTLADWVARWPKATNLGFDPETREPTIYSTAKERTKVSSIPWKREADTLTILAQPSRFSADAVAAATRRFDKIRDQRTQLRAAGDEQLRLAEAAVIEAWRTYHEAEAAVRAPLRRDVLSAEAMLRELEERAAPKGRRVYHIEDPTEKDILLSLKAGIYVPPMPLGRRGISLVPGATTSEPVVDEAPGAAGGATTGAAGGAASGAAGGATTGAAGGATTGAETQ